MRSFIPRKFVLALALAATWQSTSSATTSSDRTPIAGYEPGSDVTEHSELDLDMEKIEASADEFDWDGAIEWYTNGTNR